MSPKQKLLHMSSVFGATLLLVAYFLLGGGTAVEEVVREPENRINTDIPAAGRRDLVSGKLAALALQEREESARRRQEQLQSSFFNMLEDTASVSPSLREETLPDREPARTVAPAAAGRPKARQEPAASGSRLTASAPPVRKSGTAVMREKRRRLREVYGIDLPGEEAENEAVPAEAPVAASAQAESEPSAPAAFHGIGDGGVSAATDIRAVVHGDQKNLNQGSMIKLRLLDPVVTDYGTVPVNTLVYGRLYFSSNRAMVQMESVTLRGRVIPFRASVYDMDGFEGISVPENLVHDTGQNATGNAVSATRFNIAAGTGIIATAAGAAASAVKAAVQGSVRERKISVSSNYSVILKRDI